MKWLWKNQYQEGISWDVQEYWSQCSFFYWFLFTAQPYGPLTILGRIYSKSRHLKKLKKNRKMDFGVLIGSKLNMSQQRALAARKASSTLSSINRSTARTSLPKKKKTQAFIAIKERGGLAIAQGSTFHQQFAFSKSFLDVNPSSFVKHIPWIMSCLIPCFAISPGATSVVADGILVQELNKKSYLHGHSRKCPLPTKQQEPWRHKMQ